MASLERTIKSELEWVRKNAKGQTKKGKARLRAYDELCQAAKAGLFFCFFLFFVLLKL